MDCAFADISIYQSWPGWKRGVFRSSDRTPLHFARICPGKIFLHSNVLQSSKVGVSLNITVDYYAPLPDMKECKIIAQVQHTSLSFPLSRACRKEGFLQVKNMCLGVSHLQENPSLAKHVFAYACLDSQSSPGTQLYHFHELKTGDISFERRQLVQVALYAGYQSRQNYLLQPSGDTAWYDRPADCNRAPHEVCVRETRTLYRL